MGPGTFGPEEASTTGVGLGASGAAGASSLFGADCSTSVAAVSSTATGCSSCASVFSSAADAVGFSNSCNFLCLSYSCSRSSLLRS